MIYPKFPQRYLAAIIFCFILTLAALGAVFLIYLFNAADRSPLIFGSRSTNTISVAKPPNYFYSDDGKYSSVVNQQQQHHTLQQQHGHEQLQQQIVTTNKEPRLMHDDVELQQEQLLLDSSKNKKNMQQQRIQRVAVENSADAALVHHNQSPELFEHVVDTVYSFDAADGDEDVSDAEDIISHTNGNEDDKKYGTHGHTSSSALSESEQQQQKQMPSSSDNIDTIYIDDNERSISNIKQQDTQNAQHTDDTDTGDEGEGDLSSNSYLKNPQHEHKNYEATTTAIATTTERRLRTNNNGKQRKSKRKQQQPQQQQFQPLESKMKRKQKQRLLRKLQRQNTSNLSDSDSDSDNNKNYKMLLQQEQQKLLQYSTQQIKNQLSNKHFADNYDVAYDDDINSNQKHDLEKIAAGSGSGDFVDDDDIDDENDDNDDSDDDYDIDDETTNFIKRINLKMWRTMGGNLNYNNNKAQKKLKQQHSNFKALQKQQEQDSEQSLESNSTQLDNRKHADTTDSNGIKQQRLRNAGNIIDNFYIISSEIVSNLSSPQLYQEENTIYLTAAKPATGAITATAPTVANTLTMKSNSNIRINQMSSAKNHLGHSHSNKNNYQRLLLPLSINASKEFNISLNIGTANTQISQPQQSETKVAAVSAETTVTGPGSSSTSSSGGSVSLLETRTRRIMGNVKKSEERSRQLLLCEEAGGGELCRMLFKGHLNA